MLSEVVEDRPQVEAEERVRLVGVVIKFLYLQEDGAPLKQTAVLPGQEKEKTQAVSRTPHETPRPRYELSVLQMCEKTRARPVESRKYTLLNLVRKQRVCISYDLKIHDRY